MSTTQASRSSGLRIPGFAQLQRLGKSLMLPIAVLPAAGILLRLGQDDLLGGIDIPVIGPFFDAMSAAGGAVFSNLPLLFAVGVAIGFAKKADGSTALAAVVGYVVIAAVFETMSPIVLAGQVDQSGDQVQINYSVFAGILVGLVTAVLFDRYHTIQLPPYLGFFGGRRFVPIAVSLACLFLGFAMAYFYPLFNAGLTGVGRFIGGAGAIGAFVYGFANRMLIPIGLHHILNSFIWFLYGDYQKPDGSVVTGELTRFAAGDPTAGPAHVGLLPDPDVRAAGRRARHDPRRATEPEEARCRHPLGGRADGIPHRGHRTPRVLLHVRRAPALHHSRRAHGAVVGDRLRPRHPPRVLVLRRSHRPLALRHRTRGEEHPAAADHGRRVLRSVLLPVPVRDREVEHADAGTRGRVGVRGGAEREPDRHARGDARTGGTGGGDGDRRDGPRRPRWPPTARPSS